MQSVAVHLAVAAAFVLPPCSHALDNGLARLPPMGWMTWERFRCTAGAPGDWPSCEEVCHCVCARACVCLCVCARAYVYVCAGRAVRARRCGAAFAPSASLSGDGFTFHRVFLPENVVHFSGPAGQAGQVIIMLLPQGDGRVLRRRNVSCCRCLSLSVAVPCLQDPVNCISEQLVIEHADIMAQPEWYSAGYRYVNIDDCWEDWNRTAAGVLAWNATRFPRGMKALSEYVHGKGLKLGTYNDMGTKTCNQYPGACKDATCTLPGYMHVDAETYAAWGIDSLKMDGCFSNHTHAILDRGYIFMGKQLNETGRLVPMYQACSTLFVPHAATCSNMRHKLRASSTQASFSLPDILLLHETTVHSLKPPGVWEC